MELIPTQKLFAITHTEFYQNLTKGLAAATRQFTGKGAGGQTDL